MASVLGTLNTVNRLVCLTSLVYALYFLSVNPSPLSKRSIGGMWKYWTNWTASTSILFLLPCHCLRGIFISEISHWRLQPPCTHLPRIRCTYGCFRIYVFLGAYTRRPGIGYSGWSSSILTGSHQPHSGRFFLVRRSLLTLHFYSIHSYFLVYWLRESHTFIHYLHARRE